MPKELSSDRGPEFIAADTKGFLERWGVYPGNVDLQEHSYLQVVTFRGYLR